MNGSSQSRHRRRSAAAFSESSWLRLFVIELARPQDAKNRPERRIGDYGLPEPFSIRRTRVLSPPMRRGALLATDERPVLKAEPGE